MRVLIGPYEESEEHDPTFERQIEVEIHHYDTWNMDRTLALIILPMLKQLKATKQGVPSSMPAIQEMGWEHDEEKVLEGETQWNEIMDEMIWAFEQLCSDDDGEDQFWSEKAKCKDGTEEEKKWAGITLGDLDQEGLKAHRARIQVAMELFGKHFQDLWD